MPARTDIIVIEQGATFSKALAMGTARNGLACRAYLYDRIGGQSLAAITASDVANGITTISLTAAQTSVILAPIWTDPHESEIAVGVWMLETVDGETIERCWEGRAFLALRVTP